MELLNASISVLHDAKLYLTEVNSSEYSQGIELMSNSTIGQHTRHFIEFFQCLLEQVKEQKVNYCLRRRNLLIEEDPQAAIKDVRRFTGDTIKF